MSLNPIIFLRQDLNVADTRYTLHTASSELGVRSRQQNEDGEKK